MRPSELDFSIIRKKHYFDLTNGEVFQGRNDLTQYLKNENVNRERVVDLGNLLRNGVPPNIDTFDLINATNWSREKFQKYGKWLRNIVPPPDPKQNNLNEEVINNARRLGIGPSRKTIFRIFGSVSLFYKEIGETNARYVGIFNDWEIEDYIEYVKRIGKDQRPSYAQIKNVAANNPTLPSPKYIWGRFQHIGGLNTILELAGYSVFSNWDNSDYIDWGVKFMQANDGAIPSARMADYLSTLKKGPSSYGIRSVFNYMKDYQFKVVESYNDTLQEKELDQKEKLSQMREDLIKGNIPLNLYELGSDKLTNYYLENRSKKQHVISNQEAITLEAVINSRYDTKEIIKRYAMLKVLQEVIPYVSEEAQINIVLSTLNDPKQNFIQEIRRRYDENPGKIENAALILGFFDDIWPMNQHLTYLKLDEGFKEYQKKNLMTQKIRRQKQRLIVSA